MSPLKSFLVVTCILFSCLITGCGGSSDPNLSNLLGPPTEGGSPPDPNPNIIDLSPRNPIKPENPDLIAIDGDFVDAEYAYVQNKLVMVLENPNQLIIYDMDTNESDEINLPAEPSAVSVSTDGLRAAIGYDGRVSHVNLVNNTLLDTWLTSADTFDIVLDYNSRAHIFPTDNTRVSTVNLLNGSEQLSSTDTIFENTHAKLHPNQPFIYGANPITNNPSDIDDIEKYDINGTRLEFLYNSGNNGSLPVCGDLWLSKDGLEALTKCGVAFSTTSNVQQDLIYTGDLGSVEDIVWLDFSLDNRSFTLINDSNAVNGLKTTAVRTYDLNSFAILNTYALPEVRISGTDYPTHGVKVFYSDNSDELHVIVKTDDSANAENPYSIYSISI